MASTTFTIGSIEDGAEVEVIVTEVDGNLQFELKLISGTADINGLFFDLAGDVDIDTVYGDFTATDASTDEDMEIQAAEGDVSNLGGGINVKGDVVKEHGEFDVGIVLDETGLGNSDDLQSITFTLDATEDLTLDDILAQDFALRLTSVDEDGSRDGSLKLATTSPTFPDVPDEPEDPEDPLEPEGPEGPVGGDTSGDDPVLEDPLLDEIFVFEKDESSGDNDGNILANDDEGQTIVTVANSAGETYDVLEEGTTVPGTEGGELTVYPDGQVDFDAGSDFGNLYETDTTDVGFTYTSDTGAEGSLTVTVEGTGAPEDGGDDPVLPPIDGEALPPPPDEDIDPLTGEPLDPFFDELTMG